MKRTLLVFGGFLLCSWGSVQLWLAGYQSGYEEGSVTAWHQANEVLRPTTATHLNDNAMLLNWNGPKGSAHFVKNSD